MSAGPIRAPRQFVGGRPPAPETGDRLQVVVEEWSDATLLRAYVMDHNDPKQRRALGEQCRKAFESGHRINTYPVKKAGPVDAIVEAGLCKELVAFCEQHGLPVVDADELVHEKLAPSQRAWVTDFILRWGSLELMRASRKLGVA